mmetsp:Transcript_9234/g.22345  ORF Transcript_9234/g.22345 Transcript_9234/m.22345 type:complete len:246 (+) Transcript_9234:72-809(+)
MPKKKGAKQEVPEIEEEEPAAPAGGEAGEEEDGTGGGVAAEAGEGGGHGRKERSVEEEKGGPSKSSRAEELAEARRKAQAEAKEKRAAEEAAREAARKEANEKRAAEIAGLRKETKDLYKIDDKSIDQLSEGFVGLTSPASDEVGAMLNQLHEAQIRLVQLLAQEDRKVMTLPNMAEVAQALSHVPHYTQKLLEMRTEMNDISNRVKNMRKRAARVYTKKQQEDNSVAQTRQASMQVGGPEKQAE